MKITAHTRVAELAEGPRALMQTLRSTGLFRDGDDPQVMLGELCWTFGFNPAILLMMLESANVPEEPAPVERGPFDAMPLGTLVDHIEQTHHRWLRENMPRLAALAESVAAAHPAEASLGELRDEVRSVTAELDQHLRHEEEALFPMVRDLVARGAVTPTRCGGAVGGPIACMENEHDMTARALARLRELTGGYRAPADADPDWREMLEGLVAFDRDLREHIFKENEVLFPRALDAQRGAAPAAAAG
jgi:regulator of cell morphogenesis and NO signaling